MSDKLKIFVSNRIDLETDSFNSSILCPVRCGAVYDKRSDVDMQGDHTGDNISERRMTFCELTVQYWAWKNVEADYYGLFHYRRFFNFSKFKFPEDPYGSVVEECITEDTARIYGLQDKTMSNIIGKYDLIIPEKRDVTTFPEHPKSIYDHWCKASALHEQDLKTMLSVVARMQPDYYETAQEYLKGSYGYFCCMHIMKKELFHAYCEWLYPILFELEREIDIGRYTEEGQRTVGHLAERLLGIYIFHLQKNRPQLKIKELQTVYFTKPQKEKLTLSAAFKSEIDRTIPVVSTSRNVFAPVSAVSIQSIVENSSDNHNYDIVIIETDIAEKEKHLIKKMVAGKKNFSIRFFDATPLVNKYDLKADAGQHVPVETFYRFLIPEILPNYDKVLYLDGDLICEADVADLYATDIDGYMLAAAHDPDAGGQMHMPGSDFLTYAIKVLQMDNPYDYFQAGVLLLNTKEFRAHYSMDQWLTFARQGYRYQDQDILNKYCYGKVKFLDMSWNMLIDCNNYRVPVVIPKASASVYQEYKNARKNPRIIHYAGFEKPWERRGVDFEESFWKYARNSPYYERMIFNIACGSTQVVYSNEPNIGVKGAVKVYIRKKADKWFPKGTRRRALIKRMFRNWLK